MTGDKLGVVLERDPLGLKHTHHGHGNGHQRGLGVLGQAQNVLGTFEHGGREALAQSFVDFLEDGAGHGILVGEILAHADGLAALAGKGECSAGHDVSPLCKPM